MLKKILLNISKIGNVVLAWFNFCMFFALRPCWSGISKKLEYESTRSDFILHLPVILCVVFLLVALAITFLYIFMKKEKNLWSYIFNGVNIILLVLVIVVIALGAVDYMDYVWPEFFKLFGISAAISVVIFLIFYYPKTPLAKSNIFKFGFVGLFCLLVAVNVFNITINYITTGAVVYVVEDEYQIVFSSNTNARAWVKIGGETFYDNYNGSNRSYTKIHKVCVPQEKLDAAKSYEIHVQKITYEGPFGGYFGRDISQKYNFRPATVEDGFNYYSISDMHMARKACVKTADHMQSKELLVIAGDTVSMMDSFYDANLNNIIAHDITKGEIAVIYARGNHELKGRYSEEFHKFVGAKGEDFYYSYTLDDGKIYGVVLDIGEDHEDDYWEYYKTAEYEKYRDEQITFLDNEIKTNAFASAQYKLAVSHIPIAFINSRKNHTEPKEKMTAYLNQMDIDMMISGHQHDIFIFEPGRVDYNENGRPLWNAAYGLDSKGERRRYSGYMTDHNFINILVSKKGYTQIDEPDLIDYSSQIGMCTKVDFVNRTQTCAFNTSKGDHINVVAQFADYNYGKELVFSLDTHKIA